MRTKEEAEAFLNAVSARGEAEFDAAVEEARAELARRDAAAAELGGEA